MRAPVGYVEASFSDLRLLFARAREIIDDANNAEEQRWFRMTRWQRWWWGPKPSKRCVWVNAEMKKLLAVQPYADHSTVLVSVDFLSLVEDIVESGQVPL